jgi:DNA modification methylase/DNA invertase Pin-like site-specific DNA recombinase
LEPTLTQPCQTAFPQPVFRQSTAVPFLETLPAGSVDLVLTDPPYLISRKSGFADVVNGETRLGVRTHFGRWDTEEAFKMADLAAIVAEIHRVLRKGGTAVVFFDFWKITPLREILEQAGFKSVRLIQWVKTNPVPLNSKRCYLSNAVEIALVAVKGGGGTFNSEYDNGILSAPICRDKGRFHPTQKPLELMATLIRKHSRAGDLVVDPFAGSGTTGVAALREGRRFAGCEPDPEFFPKALARIEELGPVAETAQPSGLAGSDKGQPNGPSRHVEPMVATAKPGTEKKATPEPSPPAKVQAPFLPFSARVLPCPLASRTTVVSRPEGASDEPRQDHRTDRRAGCQGSSRRFRRPPGPRGRRGSRSDPDITTSDPATQSEREQLANRYLLSCLSSPADGRIVAANDPRGPGMTTARPRAVIYARYSTDLQNANSIRDQIAKCADKAAREGWEIVDEFADAAMSGSRNDRPAYQTMLSQLRSKRFNIVLTESLDRISRDQEDVAHFFKNARHHDVAIHTLDHGRISAMHIGFAGTMNALFLEGLTEKTHRGLAGRVKDGRSAGGRSYGYRVVHGGLDARGKPIRGGLEIDETEARIVQRIFEEYAAGRSPLHIAAALNSEGIPAPRHKAQGNAGSGHWKQNTINGNKQRGTGILNNELYVGRRVWNRLKYGKDPITRTRVSRVRPADEWLTHEVPDLRIISEELWQTVKRRQDAQLPQRQAHWTGDPKRLSGSQTLRRRKYLLSGLLECGICGGKMTVAGTGSRKRYYCSNHKEKGAAVCQGISGIRQTDAEALVLKGLRTQLMLPAAYERFRVDFGKRIQAQGRELAADQKFRLAELRQLEAQQANFVRAVGEGQALATLLPALEDVERKIAAVKAKIEASRPRPIQMPDDLPALYRRHIDGIVATLNKEKIVERAANELHRLIDRVVVRHESELGTHTVEIFGNLVALLGAADSKNAAAYEAAACSLKLVAGAALTFPDII